MVLPTRIYKAKLSCKNSSTVISDHFADIGKMIGDNSA